MTGSDEVGHARERGHHVRKRDPASYDEPAEGPALTKIDVEESFSGDISGDGVGASGIGSAESGTALVLGTITEDGDRVPRRAELRGRRNAAVRPAR